MEPFEIRCAERSDVDEIAAAHRDSIQSLGPVFYSAEVVEYWQEAITGELYLKAMEAGEVFFIALGEVDGNRAVIGFASDYCIEGSKHGTSVYVRGSWARRDSHWPINRADNASALVSNGTFSRMRWPGRNVCCLPEQIVNGPD
jgi:hypothetical protein